MGMRIREVPCPTDSAISNWLPGADLADAFAVELSALMRHEASRRWPAAPSATPRPGSACFCRSGTPSCARWASNPG